MICVYINLGKQLVKLIEIAQPTASLSTTILSSKAGSDDRHYVSQLSDLLDKSLNLDPTKRLTVEDALRHVLFKSATAATGPASSR